MKTASVLLCALLLSASGCILTSGQITATYDLGDINVVGATALEKTDVNLSTNSEYVDHKDNMKGIADLAVLGTVTNESVPANALDVEVWMTADNTAYLTAVDVKAHGIKLWGPFSLAAGETKTIDWDTSAGLFTLEGKAPLISELKGPEDGNFTLYALGASGTYKFHIPDAKLVVVLDVGL